MRNWVRWVLLIAVAGILYVMGQSVFHLKHTTEFFIIVYLLCLFLAVGFALTANHPGDM